MTYLRRTLMEPTLPQAFSEPRTPLTCRTRTPAPFQRAPGLGRELCREGDRIAGTRDGDAGAFQVHVEMLRGLDDRVDRAARRRLVPSFASADRERLSGHDGERRVPVMHRVRVHDPGHGLRV